MYEWTRTYATSLKRLKLIAFSTSHAWKWKFWNTRRCGCGPLIRSLRASIQEKSQCMENIQQHLFPRLNTMALVVHVQSTSCCSGYSLHSAVRPWLQINHAASCFGCSTQLGSPAKTPLHTAVHRLWELGLEHRDTRQMWYLKLAHIFSIPPNPSALNRDELKKIDYVSWFWFLILLLCMILMALTVLVKGEVTIYRIHLNCCQMARIEWLIVVGECTSVRDLLCFLCLLWSGLQFIWSYNLYIFAPFYYLHNEPSLFNPF